MEKTPIKNERNAFPPLNSNSKKKNDMTDIKKSPLKLNNNKKKDKGDEIEESINYWSGFEEEVSLGDVSHKVMDL